VDLGSCWSVFMRVIRRIGRPSLSRDFKEYRMELIKLLLALSGSSQGGLVWFGSKEHA
jgi:hypothetical protein